MAMQGYVRKEIYVATFYRVEVIYYPFPPEMGIIYCIHTHI